MERVNLFKMADGNVAEVPESQMGEFKAGAESAGVGFEPMIRFQMADGNVAEVPASQQGEFDRAAQAAGVGYEPLHVVRTGRGVAEVPQSLAGEFLREYHADPETEDERKKAAEETARKIGGGGVFERSPVAAGVKSFVTGEAMPSLEQASAGAANLVRGVASAPVTLAEKGLDLGAFALRGVEALYGEQDKSGAREALSAVSERIRNWREQGALGFRNENGEVASPEDWGVTAGGQLANTVAEVYLSRGASVLGKGGALATGLKALRPGALSVLYGGTRAEETARKTEAAGRSKGEQAALGLITGTLETAIESVSQVFGLQGAARDAMSRAAERSLRKMALNVVGEGAEEGAQELSSGTVEKLAGIDARTWGELGRDAAVQTAMGLLAAGVAESGAAVRLMTDGARQRAYERAAGDAELRGSVGAAEEAMRGAGAQSGEGNGGTQGGMGNGAKTGRTEQAAAGDGAGGGAAAAAGGAEQAGAGGGAGAGAENGAGVKLARAGAEQAAAAGVVRDDGARLAELHEETAPSGKRVQTVKMLMPDGRALWSADPGEVALAQYWLKDRMLFPESPRGDTGRQAGEPAVNASRRAGFDVKPGKSVLVSIGRSPKGYPATVVEVIDDTHVRVRVAKVQRALKNGRSGYADVDVRQLRQYRAAEVKAAQEEELKREGLNAEERKRVRADSAEFMRLLESGDEIADQRTLELADAMGGREGGKMRSEEIRKALARAQAMLETEHDVTTPLGRARALPRLRALLEGMRGSTVGEVQGSAVGETPEEVWLARFARDAEAESAGMEAQPFALDSMTPEEQDAELARVEAARRRQAQREELARRAEAPLTGTAGDMTGTLPGMEGVSDVPLFTENSRRGAETQSEWRPGEMERSTADEFYRAARAAGNNPRQDYSVLKELLRRMENSTAEERPALNRAGDVLAARYGFSRGGAWSENFRRKMSEAANRAASEGFYRNDAEAISSVDESLTIELANAEPGAEANAGRGGQEEKNAPRGMATRGADVYGAESGGLSGEPTAAPAADGRAGIGMDLRDAVMFFRDLTGQLPKIKEKLRNKNALGVFRYGQGKTDIELLAGIFGLYDEADAARIRARLKEKGYEGQALEAQVDLEVRALVEMRRRETMKRPLKVLTHEIAHFVDYMPDGMVKGRGNILGHIAALKNYLKGTLAAGPGEPGELTKGERDALRKQAEAEMRATLGEARTVIEEITREEPVYRELGVRPEDVRGLLGVSGGHDTPELYAWFAAQEAGVKKEILRAALKGVVDERAAAAGGGRREQVGVRTVTERVERTVPGYTEADGRRRFAELLRQETERRKLIEKRAIVAEAEAIIPWWRGVEGPMEDYFRKPEEMYAELFGIFLADPAALEQRAPTTYRAFVGWMDARPAAKREYAEFLRARETGEREKMHVMALRDAWTKESEADLQEMLAQAKTPSRRQEIMAFRYAFDRRLAAVEMVAKDSLALQLERAQSDADRRLAQTRYDRVMAVKKEYLHRAGVVLRMLIDIHGQAEKTIRDASLTMDQMGEYAFHNRVAYELDGRAAAGGWEPATSLRRLEEMRGELGEERWGALQRAWTEFRAAYEQHVIKNAYVKAMLGPEMIKMLEDNVHYVTFQHVPTREEIAAHKARLEAQKAKGGLGSEDALDVMGEELAARFGRVPGAGIYKLVGSFRPVMNPITATVQKAASMIEAGYRNEMKRELYTFAKEAGFEGVREVEMEFDPATRRRVPKEYDNAKWKTVYYMDGGELKGYVADKWLAQAFDTSDAHNIEYLRFAMKVNRVMSALYTTLNYSFYERAYIKDKQAAVANVPGLKRAPLVQYLPGGELFGMLTRYIPERYARALPKFLWGPQHLEYYEYGARRAAILIRNADFATPLKRADELDRMGRPREAEQIRRDVALASAGLSEGVLMNQSQAVPMREGDGIGIYDRSLRKYGLRAHDVSESYTLMTRMIDWVTGLGEIREDTTKLATLAYLMDKPEVTADQRKMIVTEWGGSPDFSERGAHISYVEFILGPFLNARKEGVMRNARAFADHPADWVAKKMAYTVAPAALAWMMVTPAGMELMKAIEPDDEEREKNPLWNFLKWAYEKGSFISDYLNKNYMTLPLPIETGNKDCSVVLTIPLDESEQVVRTLTWTGLDAMAEAMGIDTGRSLHPVQQAVTSVVRQSIPALEVQAPVAGTLTLIGSFLMGSNYYDPFRDKNVFTEDELNARFKDPAGVLRLMGETWNRTGGSMIKQWRNENAFGFKQPALGEFLNQPFIQPTLGKFVRVVHSGRAQAAARLDGVEESVKSVAQLDARRTFDRYVKEGYNMSADIVDKMAGNVYFSTEWQRLNSRYYRELEQNPAVEGWRNSKDPTTQMRYQKFMERIWSLED